MFIDEAKITVQLNHANIAQVYELAQISSSYFIAMEYISGTDMRAVFDRCRKKGEPSPIPLTCYSIAKCCEGLDYAHRQKDRQGRDMGIVHRDVSPQNALISYDGEVKVIDFGIAKAAGKATKTQAGILKGKFGYMSPEQIRGLPLDRRSDVFAIGVCLYEMLTGERLFVGDSDFSVLEKVRKVEVLPPTTYNRKIPEALEKIVMKALAKDVDDRYQYASELGDDLQRFLITSESIFSRKDLAQYMKATFAEEYEREKQRMMEYGDIRAPEGMLVAAEMGFGHGAVPAPSQMVPGSSSITNVPTGAAQHLVPQMSPPMIGPASTQANPRVSARNIPPPQLTPQSAPTMAPQPPPTRTPSLPRLTAVAPMLSNEKEEHTMLADGQDMFGQKPSDSIDADPVLEDEVGTDATLFSLPARKSSGDQRPPLPHDTADSELMTEAVRPPPQGRPLPANFGDPVEGLGNATMMMPGSSGADTGPSGRPAVPPARRQGGRSIAALPTVPAGKPGRPAVGIITHVDEAPARPGSNKTRFLAIGGVVLALLLATVGVVSLRGGARGLLYIEIPSDATAGVQVNINGTPIKEEDDTQLKPGPHLVPVAAGTLTVMVVADGYETVIETVEVKEGNEYTRLITKMKKK
ncbi:MAG: Serine/threonine protein kinase [Myxococcaceae bacterium]|nr:Serine/threonine protein kinase [Myxococcaceae bacterium]